MNGLVLGLVTAISASCFANRVIGVSETKISKAAIGDEIIASVILRHASPTNMVHFGFGCPDHTAVTKNGLSNGLKYVQCEMVSVPGFYRALPEYFGHLSHFNVFPPAYFAF